MRNGAFFPYCRVHLDARKISPRCGMKCGGFWACFFVRSVQLVARPNHARNVIHHLSGIHDFVRSVQLDARMNHSQNVIHHLSGIHNFVRSVQLVARMIQPRYAIHWFSRSVHLDARQNHARNVIQPFRVFTISCNKLHATGALFHIVACILMHDRTTHGTSFNPFGYSGFRATSCTLRGVLFHIVACILMHEWFHLGAEWSELLMAHASQRVPITDWYKRHALGNARHQKGLFHIVACILKHERTTHGTLFNPFRYSRFRA